MSESLRSTVEGKPNGRKAWLDVLGGYSSVTVVLEEARNDHLDGRDLPQAFVRSSVNDRPKTEHRIVCSCCCLLDTNAGL